MDTFEVGNHVLIELDDTRRVAGVITGMTEHGYLLKVTHRDLPAVHMVSERLAAAIRDELDQVPWGLLAVELVSRGMYSSVGRKAVMVEALAKLQEAEMVEKNQEAKPMTFHELSVPVLTFINGGAVTIMEDSEDVLNDMEFNRKLENFKAGMDEGIEEILKVADEAPE